MEPSVHLYSLRAQGWVYNNGGYGSLRSEAKRFTPAEAIEYAKRAMPREGGSVLLPIREDDIIAIEGATL